jgi:hypothetical protein
MNEKFPPRIILYLVIEVEIHHYIWGEILLRGAENLFSPPRRKEREEGIFDTPPRDHLLLASKSYCSLESSVTLAVSCKLLRV